MFPWISDESMGLSSFLRKVEDKSLLLPVQVSASYVRGSRPKTGITFTMALSGILSGDSHPPV